MTDGIAHGGETLRNQRGCTEGETPGDDRQIVDFHQLLNGPQLFLQMKHFAQKMTTEDHCDAIECLLVGFIEELAISTALSGQRDDISRNSSPSTSPTLPVARTLRSLDCRFYTRVRKVAQNNAISSMCGQASGTNGCIDRDIRVCPESMSSADAPIIVDCPRSAFYQERQTVASLTWGDRCISHQPRLIAMMVDPKYC